ncbi:TOBE domain-containing protein [Aquabacterium sp.]|uniref:TOBE domain-containing protein n=1 Tax=Aquabacterium sp. TaxID=1872578 RepID=UPI0035B2B45A
MSESLPSNKSFEIHGSVWMTVDGENFGGRGRVELLRHIASCGSITRAAKAMSMSYKAAWDAIDAMNQLAGEPLVQRMVGGSGGGGTKLTPRGERLIHNFERIEREHRRFVEAISAQAEQLADDYLLFRKLDMKTSARNQFFGKVTRVVPGAVNDEIDIDIGSGHSIAAIVTHESTQSLDLKVGRSVFALIKASSIIVVADEAGSRFSARNRLSGQVARLQGGAVNTDVTIELPGGANVSAIITNESCAHLQLAVGSAATAIFKASSVIVGVTD